MDRASPAPDRPPASDSTPGAGGVVFDPRGRVLLIRERSGAWVFPKGHIDPGESALEAARREVAEEAGVGSECPDPGRTWTTRYVNDRGEPRAITWFRLRSDGEPPVMREAKFPEGGYFAPDAALERLAYPEDRALLERVLSPDGSPDAPDPASRG